MERPSFKRTDKGPAAVDEDISSQLSMRKLAEVYFLGVVKEFGDYKGESAEEFFMEVIQTIAHLPQPLL